MSLLELYREARDGWWPAGLYEAWPWLLLAAGLVCEANLQAPYSHVPSALLIGAAALIHGARLSYRRSA